MFLKMILLSALLVLAFQVPGGYCKGYVGCYWDNKKRALPHWGGSVASPPDCQRRCRAANYRYAGVQATTQCHCGTNYNRYGKTKGCINLCVTLNDICGGSWANSVFLAFPSQVPKYTPSGYWGCFRDKKVRAMQIYAGHVSSIPMCVGKCRTVFYQPFAGLQYSNECWCGTSYGRYGTTNTCKMLCPRGLVCGGDLSLSVYRVYGVPTKPKPAGGHMGCYRDNTKRSLPIRVSNVQSARECIMKCLDKKQPYAGLQMGKGCYCGSNYAKYGKQTNCKSKCQSGDICGGFSSNSVYRVYKIHVKANPPGGYMGCYKDSGGNRALPHRADNVASIRECVAMCRVKKQRFAGLQSGIGCYCGSNYARYGKSNDCKSLCASGETCGGFSVNSVYRV